MQAIDAGENLPETKFPYSGTYEPTNKKKTRKIFDGFLPSHAFYTEVCEPVFLSIHLVY